MMRKAGWLLSVLVIGAACIDLAPLRQSPPAWPESPTLYLLPEPADSATADLADELPVPPGPEPDLPVQIDFQGLEEFDLALVEPALGGVGGGDLVMLVGKGFHDGMEVYFGEQRTLPPFVVSGNYATIETPPAPPGVVTVRLVGTAGQEVTLADGFTYWAPVQLTGVEPPEGADSGGTALVLSGAGFDGSCRLFVGGRPAAGLVVTGPDELLAATPPGHCGSVDLLLQCAQGTALLKDGFTYLGSPRIDSLWPMAAPAEGGVLVTVQGRGFTPGMSVLVGEFELLPYDIYFIAPSLIQFVLPPGAPGVASLALGTICGEAVAESAIIYLPEPAESGPGAIIGALPAELPACAGGFVTVGLTWLGDPAWLTLLGNGEQLEVVGIDVATGTVDVAVGPAAAGDLLISAVTDSGPAAGAALVKLVDRPVLELLDPSEGPTAGGIEVVASGCGWSPPVELRFGALAAPAPWPLGGAKVVAKLPPGPPGPADVTLVSGQGDFLLPGGFLYQDQTPSLHLVEPDVGAVSGGTFVRFHLNGAPPDGRFVINGRECFDRHFVDSSYVTARVPPNPAGTYDVVLQWAGGESVLPQGFTYFQPMSKYGGTWGGPIDEALNVTVLDSSTGKGLAAAYVMVGSEAATPHQGYTDENGQITFSLPGFGGPATITAARPGYTLYSVVHFDATNVTVYLTPIILPDYGGGSYTPTVSYVGGRVLDLNKYLVVPPGDCAAWGPSGINCKPCEGDGDCLGGTAEEPIAGICTKIGPSGSYCSAPCLAPEECPADYACRKITFEQNGCVPVAGTPEVRCQSTMSSMFGSPPDPGPGTKTNGHDIYFIKTATGEVAIVCYGGYVDSKTLQFRPTSMGLRRHVIVLPGQVKKDQDVELSIPLTGEARVGFHDLPYHPAGVRKPYLLASIELGKEGYIALPEKPLWVDNGSYFLMASLPAAMTGPLLGASFSFYASVQSQTTYSIPYAVRMVTEVTDLSGDGVIQLVSGEEPQRLHPPIKGDIIGLDLPGDGQLRLFTDRGEAFFFDGLAWSAIGLPDPGEGFSAWHQEPNGRLWLGGKKGGVWHFDGVGWQRTTTGFKIPVKDIWAANGKAAVLFPSALMTVQGGAITGVSYPPAAQQFRAVWGADFEDLYLITTSYVSGDALWNRTPAGFELLYQAGQNLLMQLDGAGADHLWAVANPGRLLSVEGKSIVELATSPPVLLAGVEAFSDGQVLTWGADGALFSVVGDELQPITTGTLQDLFVVARSPSGGVLAAAGAQTYELGPFLAFPRILQPEPDTFFDFGELSWTFWSEGATADYHQLILSTDEGYSFWTMIVDGSTLQVTLPPIVAALGANVIPDGGKRLNLTSSLQPGFSIDGYTLNDFSMFNRISWSIDLVRFK